MKNNQPVDKKLTLKFATCTYQVKYKAPTCNFQVVYLSLYFEINFKNVEIPNQLRS